MSLKRFRIEVEGEDEEDVEQQLDLNSAEFFKSARRNWIPSSEDAELEFECTDEAIKPIARNGLPLMYGRRVFKVTEKEDADA